MNFQTHNDLQTFHVIAMFVAFKKLSQIRSSEIKDFVFITLKLLILEFNFSKGARGGRGQVLSQASPQLRHW